MNRLVEAFSRHPRLLMEAAIGTRLRAEYGIPHHPLLDMAAHVADPAARRALDSLYSGYLDVAERHGLPLLVNTATRRANRDRLALAGAGDEVFAENAGFFADLLGKRRTKAFVGGGMGCRGDAYTADGALAEEEAEEFHHWAASRFARVGVDYLYAGLMPSLSESVGMARACARSGLPCVMSFTLTADGALPDGTRLAHAIARIDAAASPAPLAYMTNCIHPTRAARALAHPDNQTPLVRRRFLGIMPNASPLPAEQLDKADGLRSSDPAELAEKTAALSALMDLRIVGGCCGSDDAYLDAVAGLLSGPPGFIREARFHKNTNGAPIEE